MTEPRHAVAWTTAAKRALARVPEKVGAAVVEFAYGPLAENPARVGKPLRLGLEGIYSARRGDYRILYLIDDRSQRVVVIGLEHRSDAYRRRSR